MPDLKYREVVNLLLYFGMDLVGEGSPWLKVRARSGGIVTVHCHPSQGAVHATVMRTVKRLGVGQPEFEAWLRAGKKPR